jgi:hypothetical protein
MIPVNALVLIGLDLALRDWLHVRLRAVEMLALIAAAGALTYAFNPDAGRIGWAGSVAFTSAALVDWRSFGAARSLAAALERVQRRRRPGGFAGVPAGRRLLASSR